MSESQVSHNRAQQRFELTLDGELCHADYHEVDHVWRMTHTFVPSSLGGRGLAGQLVQAAADAARSEGKKIVPACSYVRVWLERHPDYADVRAGREL